MSGKKTDSMNQTVENNQNPRKQSWVLAAIAIVSAIWFVLRTGHGWMMIKLYKRR